MPLQNITYNEIVTQLRSYITTNCKNVDNNFNSLPAVFKSGYTKTTNLTNSGSIRSSCIERITTYVSRVSSTTINNDINAYLNTLAAEGLLEIANQNEVRISYEKNKSYLESKGKDTSKMSYQEIITANTGSNVFLDGLCSPTDTMEDLDLGMYLFESFEDEAA